MRSRAGAVLLALLALLLVAACGGGGGGGKTAATTGGGSVPTGADYAPSSSVAFVSIDSDAGSSQWKTASDLLDKFPGRDMLVAQVEKSLSEQQVSFEKDVKPALGPETDVAVLKFQGDTGNAIGLTEPKDESKLEALFRKASKQGAFFARIGGWTAASDAQAAADAAKTAHEGTSLAENPAFTDAIKDLPSDALVRAWVDGAAIGRGLQGLLKNLGQTGTSTGSLNLRSLALALQARSDGVALQTVARSTRSIPLSQYRSKLVDEVPAGVLAYLSFRGLGNGIDQVLNSLPPSAKTQVQQFESQLGVSISTLTGLLKGEGALYVRQGIPLPEVTLVVEESDTGKAQATVDSLAQRLAPSLGAQVVPTTVDGVGVKQIKTSNFSIYYGTFAGKLVVTDATTGISGLKDTGQKLSGDPRFTAAKDAAGMPDQTAGFLYVNLKDTIPLVENAVSSFGGTVQSAVQQNLDPLDSMLFYATVDGDKASLSGFVGVK